MRTLLVDFYRKDNEAKLAHYRTMIRCCTEDTVEARGSEVERGYDLEGIQAVILSGSQWMLADEDPPEGLKDFVRRLEIPTLGICFGHQLLARSFGAKVSHGETIERTETIVELEPHSLFEGLGPETEMLESHREFVEPLSADRIGWDVFARSASCAVEAMHHPERPLYGVQFHPERSGLNGQRLITNFYERIVRPFAVSAKPR